MKEIIGFVFAIVIVLSIIIMSIFGIDWISLQWYKFIGPQRENIRREVFLNTRSYNEGKIQDLLKYRHEYMLSKDPDEKAAIASTVRHMFAEYDETKLSPELSEFLREIKYGRINYD